jgi:hypothetical protein
MGHLRKTIHYYHDGIMAAGRAGKSEHKVHAHVVPWSCRHWKRCVEASIFPYLLGEGAHPALSDDVPNIALQARPIELMFYGRNRLVTTKVAGKTSGMALPSEMIPERRAWNAQPILKE